MLIAVFVSSRGPERSHGFLFPEHGGSGLTVGEDAPPGLDRIPRSIGKRVKLNINVMH